MKIQPEFNIAAILSKISIADVVSNQVLREGTDTSPFETYFEAALQQIDDPQLAATIATLNKSGMIVPDSSEAFLVTGPGSASLQQATSSDDAPAFRTLQLLNGRSVITSRVSLSDQFTQSADMKAPEVVASVGTAVDQAVSQAPSLSLPVPLPLPVEVDQLAQRRQTTEEWLGSSGKPLGTIDAPATIAQPLASGVSVAGNSRIAQALQAFQSAQAPQSERAPRATQLLQASALTPVEQPLLSPALALTAAEQPLPAPGISSTTQPVALPVSQITPSAPASVIAPGLVTGRDQPAAQTAPALTAVAQPLLSPAPALTAAEQPLPAPGIRSTTQPVALPVSQITPSAPASVIAPALTAGEQPLLSPAPAVQEQLSNSMERRQSTEAWLANPARMSTLSASLSQVKAPSQVGAPSLQVSKLTRPVLDAEPVGRAEMFESVERRLMTESWLSNAGKAAPLAGVPGKLTQPALPVANMLESAAMAPSSLPESSSQLASTQSQLMTPNSAALPAQASANLNRAPDRWMHVDDLGKQFGSVIQSSLLDRSVAGQTSLRIMLYPENMGSIEAEIIENNHSVTVNLTVQSDEVVRLLRDNSQALRDALGQSGTFELNIQKDRSGEDAQQSRDPSRSNSDRNNSQATGLNVESSEVDKNTKSSSDHGALDTYV